MDRRTVTQLVAMVVVLSILMRWLPSEEKRSVLGLGDPWRTIAMDREVHTRGGDTDAAVAFLRYRPPPAAPQTMAERQRMQQSLDWLAKLKAVRELRQAAGPDTVVEFQGVPRNEVWPLMYRLYPVPTTPWTLEQGSRFGESLYPGATVFPKGLDQQRFLKSVEQMKDGQRRQLGLPPDAPVSDELLPEWARRDYAERVREELREEARAYEPPVTAQRTRAARAEGGSP